MAAITICTDFGAQKINYDTASTVSPFISHEVMGPDAMILVLWMLSFIIYMYSITPQDNSRCYHYAHSDEKSERKWSHSVMSNSLQPHGL